jgi:hypothetical protein
MTRKSSLESPALPAVSNDSHGLWKIAGDRTLAPGERLAAVAGITDAEVARSLVEHLLHHPPHHHTAGDADVAVLVAAIHKVKDPALLAAIALPRLRENPAPLCAPCVVAAVEGISDPALLAEICREHAPRFFAGEEQSPVCDAALSRIDDEALLLETALAIDRFGVGGRHLRLIRPRIADPTLRARLDRELAARDAERASWTEQP